MNKLFVSYEIALKLKEKGFNEGCFGFYGDDGKLYFDGFIEDGLNPVYSLAPLYQQVIDWLRDEKYINIETQYDFIAYDVIIHDYKNSNTKKLTSTLSGKTPYCFTDYYEALNVAIEESLKLI